MNTVNQTTDLAKNPGNSTAQVPEAGEATARESRFKLDFIWVAAGVFLLVAGVLTWWGLGKIKSNYKSDLENILQVTLKNSTEGFKFWAGKRKDEIRTWSRSAELRNSLKKLLNLPKRHKALLSSPEMGKLRALLKPLIEENRFEGFFLIAPDFITLASMRDDNVGSQNFLVNVQHDYLLRIFKGEELVSRPVYSDVVLPEEQGIRRRTSMFVGGPVYDGDGRIIAAMTFRINPINNILRMTNLNRFGGTGEIYSFDEKGRFLSSTRFEKDIRRLGIIAPEEEIILNVKIRDPGRNMLEEPRGATMDENTPLTLMAQQAVQGLSGINLKGYRNYLGIPVVGAWQWNEDQDLGFAAEMQVEEAYEGYEQTRITILLILGLAGLMFFAFVAAMVKNRGRLLKMNREVNLKSDDLAKKNWVTSTLSQLYERMRGEPELATLIQNVLGFLAERLNAKVGAVYLKEGEVLRMVASYAYQKRKNLSNEFRLGESLVGQAALEKQDIVVTHVPGDYVRVSSGLGDTAPNHILVAPLVYEDTVMGVLELGTLGEFDDLQTELVQEAKENLAINISAAMVRRKNQELLERTQAQSKELQAQQEELRQTNEELENQAKALQESEAELISQQEELRQTNEDLEQQTRELEKQRIEVEGKNSLIQEKAEELELASRYKSEFLANMSHELRTPLNSMLLLSRMLADNKDGNLTDKQVEFAGTIMQAGTDLLNLINDILDLSKVESGKMELFLESADLNEIARETRKNFQHVAEDKGLQFKVELGKGLPAEIKTDVKRLNQVLKNLLSNAFKFTQKGTVTVRVFRPGGDTVLARSGLDPATSVGFSVADTGKGINPAKQKVIFEAFQQEDGATNRKYGGTGLGLSISRELVKLLGGEMQLESVEGNGSTFSIYLPEQREGEATSTASMEDHENLEAGAGWNDATELTSDIPDEFPVADDRAETGVKDRSLLIIEDDPEFCKILKDLAHEKNFKCLIAGDGESGIMLAQKYRPAAIILDIGLPGIDGMMVLNKLKSNPATRGIPVHFISAAEKSIYAMKLGAIGFLQKPVTPEQLEEVFKRFENIVSNGVKNLLVVEDDPTIQASIRELLKDEKINFIQASGGEEAVQCLEAQPVDCMILDLNLGGTSGFDVLEHIRRDPNFKSLPVIIYTGKDLSRKEEETLRKYSESIIVKGVCSPERLLDETTLFLHRVKQEEGNRKSKTAVADRHQENIAELKDKKVLIVDDDLRNIFALTHVLEDQQMNVVIAKNGKEALEQIKNHLDTDIILMDVMMPEMDGFQAMKDIRKMKQFQKTPILALTAKAMKGDKQKCMEAGANDYLAKPVDSDNLLSQMRVWLSR